MKLSARARKLVVLDRDGLMKAGASAILALDASTLGGSVSLLADPASEEPAQDKIGLVRIEGPLAQRAIADLCAYVDGYDAVTARVGAALAASDVLGVLLVIDSPGGDVAGLEEAVNRMRSMVEASGKPVVAYVDEIAASAAYWIAIGVADEVQVPASGYVGSIGCIGAWADMSEAWKNEGVAWNVVREPAGKAERMPAAPIADLANERLVEGVKAAAGRFFEAVAARRNLTTKVVRGLNGALLMGDVAVTQGLADKVGTLEGAANRVLELAQERRSKRSKDRQMKLTAIAAALCGLSADASPEAAEVALATTAKDILDATGAKTLADVSASVESLKTQLSAHAEKSDRLAKLEAQLVIDEKAAKAAKIETTIDAAVKDGKITPAKREDMAAKGAKFGQEWLDALIETLPIQGGTYDAAKGIQAPENDKDAIDAALKADLAKYGCSEEDYHKARAAGLV